MKLKLFTAVFLVLAACNTPAEQNISSTDPVNWEKKKLTSPPPDSVVEGRTYLSVYSQIYTQTEHKQLDLTATVSLRNTSDSDTIYISKAEYFNTSGKALRNYFKGTIFLRPMETVEIVIDEIDKEGGTGANFIFDWKTKPGTSEPLFECVMISTASQYGLSFSTFGKRLY
ncbi:MAG: DUF3124 domain-containing protein [Fulvivirga sp.]|uniref:DUF3124 domain-containing protein n=1 Tax=Fulvivirga sp. TaxID=1931237 RepID=UPI0032FBE894